MSGKQVRGKKRVYGKIVGGSRLLFLLTWVSFVPITDGETGNCLLFS